MPKSKKSGITVPQSTPTGPKRRDGRRGAGTAEGRGMLAYEKVGQVEGKGQSPFKGGKNLGMSPKKGGQDRGLSPKAKGGTYVGPKDPNSKG